MGQEEKEDWFLSHELFLSIKINGAKYGRRKVTCIRP